MNYIYRGFSIREIRFNTKSLSSPCSRDWIFFWETVEYVTDCGFKRYNSTLKTTLSMFIRLNSFYDKALNACSFFEGEYLSLSDIAHTQIFDCVSYVVSRSHYRWWKLSGYIDERHFTFLSPGLINAAQIGWHCVNLSTLAFHTLNIRCQP